MSVQRVDKSALAVQRSKEAGKKAIDAAANLLQQKIEKAFGFDYYKGGAFRSTLYVKQSVRRVGPIETPQGWESIVGTHLIEALYWELGHRNRFTRKRERVRIWEPTARKEKKAMQQKYASVFARYMNKE